MDKDLEFDDEVRIIFRIFYIFSQFFFFNNSLKIEIARILILKYRES